MKTKVITLPLPAKELSPNARVHWAKKSPITKKHRSNASARTMYCLTKGDQIASYMLYFFWKDKRRHDRDNASASCKAYLDGIADAIGQDDSTFEFDGVRFAIDKDNPRVEVRVILKD